MEISVLDDRKQKILQAIIHHYIKTATPVGSKTIKKNYHFPYSTASIRNIMAELEKAGYLAHIFTSSGRVPTDKGYRFYVDKLMEIQSLTEEEEKHIKKEYEIRQQELEQIMRETSRLLSLSSRYTGFVLAPKLEDDTVRRLELMPLENKKILAVLMTETGIIRHKILSLEEEIKDDDLRRVNKIVNEKLKGVSLGKLSPAIIKKIIEEKQYQDKIYEVAWKLTRQAFNIEAGNELYLEGAANILTHLDFNDYNKMRNIFKIIEEKKILCNILQNEIKGNGVKVFIGKENTCKDLADCSIVSSTYKAKDKTIGALGIIGPKRMEYPKMIALVECMSKVVNKTLSKLMKETEEK